jgi:hypothetical protein
VRRSPHRPSAISRTPGGTRGYTQVGAPAAAKKTRRSSTASASWIFFGRCHSPSSLRGTLLNTGAAEATRARPDCNGRLRQGGVGGHRTTIGQFRLTVTPFALTTAWKTRSFPRGAASSTLASRPVDAHQS